MGQYFKPVNLDKRQQVHPHRVGDGLKLGEWYEWNGEPIDSATRRRVQSLLGSGEWSRDDEVRVLGDEGDSFHWSGPQSTRPADYDEEWEDASQ